MATFVYRKTGIKLRIYPQHLNEYGRFLDTLPVKMKKEIIKSSVCKRLINPDDCNPKCVLGYDFIMDSEHYQKCRYMAFMPTLTEESTSYMKEFLQKEISKENRAGIIVYKKSGGYSWATSKRRVGCTESAHGTSDPSDGRSGTLSLLLVVSDGIRIMNYIQQL